MTYEVGIAVNGRYYVTVEADSAKEAYEKAEMEFMTTEIEDIEVVDSHLAQVIDENGKYYYESDLER